MSQSPALKSVLDIIYSDYGRKLRKYDNEVYKELQQLMNLEGDSLVNGFSEFMDQYGERIDFWHPIASEVLYELSRNIAVEA